MPLDKIIVSESSFASEEAYDIIWSNITVINLLREEGIDDDQIPLDALRSYYADYYLAQSNNGGFSQYVWNSKWSVVLNELVKDGLSKIGAAKHLALFQSLVHKVETLKAGELEAFLDSAYFGENSTRDLLDDNSFFDIEEDIIALNARWLKAHPQLLVLSIENMFLELEKFIGRPLER